MPKVKLYNQLKPLMELGPCAELHCNSICFDISNLNVKEMLTIYEPEIRSAEKVFLKSEEIGNWKYIHNSRKWERMWN